MPAAIHTEALPLFATLRDGDDELHLEIRMSDGQKAAFVTVDIAFPELAHRLVEFLNVSAEGGWQDAERLRMLSDAIYENKRTGSTEPLDARRLELLEAFHERLLERTDLEARQADVTRRFGNAPGFQEFARMQGLNITPTDPHTLTSRKGLFPATYFEDETEYAWRGWANRK